MYLGLGLPLGPLPWNILGLDRAYRDTPMPEVRCSSYTRTRVRCRIEAGPAASPPTTLDRMRELSGLGLGLGLGLALDRVRELGDRTMVRVAVRVIRWVHQALWGTNTLGVNGLAS